MNLWMTRLTGFTIGAGIALAMISAPPAQAQWPFSAPIPLAQIEENVAARHDSIAHVAPEDFAAMQDAGEAFILLDVREKSEFDVSHIAGAIQVDPGAKASDVRALLTGTDADTPVVVYCSVGRRSSRLGSRVVDGLDGRKVSNLRGGVFAWHNEARPLENATGTTNAIHPYNTKWGELIERSDSITYVPTGQ